MTDDPGCDVCPLDPCKINAEECLTMWRVIDIFMTLSNERRSCEYLHGSEQKVIDDAE